MGKEVIKIEQSHMLFEVNLPEPIGISLVDGIPQEIAYIQVCEGHFFRPKSLNNLSFTMKPDLCALDYN